MFKAGELQTSSKLEAPGAGKPGRRGRDEGIGLFVFPLVCLDDPRIAPVSTVLVEIVKESYCHIIPASLHSGKGTWEKSFRALFVMILIIMNRDLDPKVTTLNPMQERATDRSSDGALVFVETVLPPETGFGYGLEGLGVSGL